MRALALLAAAAAAALGVAPAASQAVPEVTPLTAEQLDQLRGGFELPGGVVVTLGVLTVTRLDGREVLRSTVNLSDGAPEISVLATKPGESSRELTPVDLARDGGGVATADGIVRLRTTAGGTRVELAGDGIDVAHMIGRSIGSVIANTGSDRSIDVATTINVEMRGMTPDAIGGSLVRVEGLALDSTTRLTMR